jgi:hypothetical protein
MLFTSSPPCSDTASRSSWKWLRRNESAASSPSRCSRAVDSTRSVKRIVTGPEIAIESASLG